MACDIIKVQTEWGLVSWREIIWYEVIKIRVIVFSVGHVYVSHGIISFHTINALISCNVIIITKGGHLNTWISST